MAAEVQFADSVPDGAPAVDFEADPEAEIDAVCGVGTGAECPAACAACRVSTAFRRRAKTHPVLLIALPKAVFCHQ
ncbi:hypothetical protein EJ06DRAFT_559651 [Trichodelitschia bisporula]|uniref:Uncharacterized protein n=1 Tax=Trichodelitschia bisporula TaxID=703511 RepID=A0A6G1HKC7_9PEZI|nr:hypothetical protein EJ06DRAFT_559651 [Trichodelitschia bisporula]